MGDIVTAALLTAHVIGAAAWVGGQIAHEFAFSKKLGVINPSQAGLISKHAEFVFTLIPWASLITMSASGLAMLYYMGLLTSLDSLGLFLSNPVWWPIIAGMALTLVAIINGLLLTFYYPPRLNLYRYSMSPVFRRRVMLSIMLQNRIGLAIIVLMSPAFMNWFSQLVGSLTA